MFHPSLTRSRLFTWYVAEEDIEEERREDDVKEEDIEKEKKKDRGGNKQTCKPWQMPSQMDVWCRMEG